jgi:hypothetical protein
VKTKIEREAGVEIDKKKHQDKLRKISKFINTSPPERQLVVFVVKLRDCCLFMLSG